MYELRDVNDKFIKEITYKEMMEKLNNHEAGLIKENKRIVGCRLYEPIKTIEIEQEEIEQQQQQEEELIKDNVEVAENDDLPNTKKIIIRTIIGAPLFLSFFFMFTFTLTFMEEICCLLAVLLIYAMVSFLSLMGRALRYCAVREAYNAYKGRR